MVGRDKLDCVPLFLGELADDLFVCGKTINLLKLCCPDVRFFLLSMTLLILFYSPNKMAINKRTGGGVLLSSLTILPRNSKFPSSTLVLLNLQT